MYLDLVAADEQAQIRNSDSIDRIGGEQCTVEERRDAWQEILVAEFGTQPAPRRAAAQREREAVGVVDVADDGGDLGQVVPNCTVEQGFQDLGPSGRPSSSASQTRSAPSESA